MAWGNTKYYNHVSTDFWHYNINYREDFVNDKDWVPFYWDTLLHDSEYIEQMRNRWSQYRASNYSTESIMNKVDSISSLLEIGGALERNEKAWQIFSTSIWGVGYSVDSYQSEIDYLKNWILGRLDFMDNEFSVSTSVFNKFSDYNLQKTVIYNMQGIELSKEPDKGCYIIVRNGNAIKMMK